VTLQFIGRFTRRGENVGDAAVIINIADPNAEKRLEELYAEGAERMGSGTTTIAEVHFDVINSYAALHFSLSKLGATSGRLAE